MKDADFHSLREDGWGLEVLTTLCSLGYELASYDAASCEAHFSTLPSARGDQHGFTLHRQDSARQIRQNIFEAGALAHGLRTRAALTELLFCGGLRIA
jgi:hypothetical protein